VNSRETKEKLIDLVRDETKKDEFERPITAFVTF
jgi:hypothetical protein